MPWGDHVEREQRHPASGHRPIIERRFTFDAAHRLPHVPEGHKCGVLHGHSYTVWIEVQGVVAADEGAVGWVVDFADIDAICSPIRKQLDHTYLNDVEGLENPTAENVAAWIYARLKGLPPSCSVYQVTVQEGFGGRATVRPGA